jgi:hypothetical protein
VPKPESLDVPEWTSANAGNRPALNGRNPAAGQEPSRRKPDLGNVLIHGTQCRYAVFPIIFHLTRLSATSSGEDVTLFLRGVVFGEASSHNTGHWMHDDGAMDPGHGSVLAGNVYEVKRSNETARHEQIPLAGR